MSKESQSSSPLPKKPAQVSTQVPKLLSFTQAVSELITGKKVAREIWPDKKEHCLIKDEYLMIFRPDGVYYKWLVAEVDMKANDWYVI